MAKKGRRLSKRDMAKQHAAALPKREAMSFLPSTLAPLPPVGGADAYGGAAQGIAADQSTTAEHAVKSADATGVNNPQGTATAFSQT
jgi:hypothetical protein